MATSGKVLSELMVEFSLDVYQHLVSNPDKGNLFMSPSSMMTVLSMLYVGARNDTEKQMTDVLKLKQLNQKAIFTKMETFVSTLQKGSKSVTLNTANRLYPHTDKTILEDYLSTVKKYFHADLKSMDYSTQSEEARLEINKWVEEVTKDKIKDLLPAGSLNALTAMVVVNAIYFKGDWATQFKPSATKKMKFTSMRTGVNEVSMMNAKMKKVKYGENPELACKVLELPYVGEELSMIIILPNDIDGLPALEKKLTPKILLDLTSDIYPNTVEISLPKFKLESSLEMKAALSALGMPDLFDANKADLTGMGNDLYVSAVFHKAFVDVNEEGTEAAAATAAVVMKRSIQITQKFVADHPFLFMIWDHRLEGPLFIGRFTDPPAAGQSAQQKKEEL